MFPFVPGIVPPVEEEQPNPLTQNLPATGLSQQPPVPPVPPVVPPPAAQSFCASTRGITDEGLAQAGRVYSPTDKRVAAQSAPLRVQAEQNLEQHQGNAAALGQAVDEQGRATQEHQASLAKLKEEERLFHQDAAALEERMHLETKAESEAYVGAYREQIAAVRAMTVDPTGPIASLTTAQAGGLSLAMFAQGFLAAQGIQIDVSGQLDKWVDRSIQEQQRRITQAEKGAQDILNLWDIARQSSRDDQEARTRYRGMVIAGMAAATEAKAAQFNSNIAMSRAKEATAKLNIELAVTERSIQDGYFNKVHAIKQAEYQRAYQMGSLAQQSKQLSETIRHNKENEDIARNKDKGGSGLVPVKHPGKLVRKDGKVVGAQVEYLMDPKVATEQTKKVSQQYGEFRQSIQKLRELRPPAMDDFIELGPAAAASAFSEAYRRYQRNKNMVGEQLINVLTGAAAPEAQMKRIFGVLADDKLWQKGSNSSGLDDLEHWFATKFESAMNFDPGVTRIPDDQLKEMEAQGKHFLPVSQDENESADIVNARKSAGESLPAGAAASAFSNVTNVDSQAVLSRDPKSEGDPTLYWEFTQQDAKGRDTEPFKKEHQHMETLAHMIIDPTVFAGQESAEEIRAEAQQALSRLATSEGYAAYLLGVSTSNPNKFLNKFAPQSTIDGDMPTLESMETLKLK